MIVAYNVIATLYLQNSVEILTLMQPILDDRLLHINRSRNPKLPPASVFGHAVDDTHARAFVQLRTQRVLWNKIHFLRENRFAVVHVVSFARMLSHTVGRNVNEIAWSLQACDTS